ncbi:MAG: ABC transporter ATP-binding protein [Synergistetes bacterium]|nr:ABC transporter ATP-binding protein [Synergistota bacterium]
MGQILKVEGLTKDFGGLRALSNYALSLEEGELVGLIGPNGAGKTTVFNLLTGVIKPTAGRICFRGVDITGKRPDKIAALGMSRTFQNIRLFGALSVIDNLKVAYHMHRRYGLVSALLGFSSFKREEMEIEQRALELLELFDIERYKDRRADSLPYGDQRKVEIVRALMTGPELLLLDEPACGMNPQETEELMELIKRIREEFSLTIFLIEHDMKVVMGICERIQVLNKGELLAEGKPEEIRENPKVIEAYLGRRKSVA